MEPTQKSNVAAIVAVVVVILAAIGGYMIWDSKMAEKTVDETESMRQQTAEEDSLAAELDASVNFDNSTEMSAIDSEFKN